MNFITAHDGFTLNDLVSFNEKHNEANGEDNRDGSDHDRSWNCGAEGPTDDAEINRLRERQIRNFLATLLLSQGVPMLLAGDEFGRTQQGNNNAYCQDSDISWLNWKLEDKGKGLVAFAQRLTELRAANPALRHRRYLTGIADDTGRRDLTWVSAGGGEMTQEEWDGGAKCFGMVLDVPADAASEDTGERNVVLLVINGHDDLVTFTLPDLPEKGEWHWLLDTNLAESQEARFASATDYDVSGRSVLLFSAGA